MEIKSPLLGPRQFLRIESPLKMIENAFYFMLKSIFVLEMLNLLRSLHFCLKFLFIQKNGLIKKVLLISKFMTSQTGQKIITIHISPGISRSEGSQALKFGQLIKYSVRSTFFQKSCGKFGRKTSSRAFFVF